MKKATMFTLIATFLIAGVIFYSCKKDGMQDIKSTIQSPVLKDAMGLNLFMGQFTDIGDVNIYVTFPTLYVDVVLDEIALDGFQVVESHLWASPEIPPYPQAFFPNYWEIDMGPFPGSWSFDVSSYAIPVTCWDGSSFTNYDFDWNFALHMQLEKVVSEPVLDEFGNPVLDEFGNPVFQDVTYEESAWVLNDGTNWLNKKGKPMGWGEYFLVPFELLQECPPEPPV